MKPLFAVLFVFILINVNRSYGQQAAPKESVYNLATVEVMPEFPGGMQQFYQYVARSFKYPAEAVKAEVSGRITAQFVVEKDGSISNVIVLKDLGYGLGDEAKRVLASSPKWQPGVQNGKPVRVQYTLPLMLSIPPKAKQ